MGRAPIGVSPSFPEISPGCFHFNKALWSWKEGAQAGSLLVVAFQTLGRRGRYQGVEERQCLLGGALVLAGV